MHIVLHPGREKSLRRRHPWVFSGAIDETVGDPSTGDTVDVLDAGRRFLARAAYSPKSQIRLRVWSFDDDESIDAEFFRRRLSQAIDARRRLGLDDPNGACRLVFAESDWLPGLVVDRFGEFLVAQFLAAGAERWREIIVDALADLLPSRGIFERSEASVRRKEGLPSRQGLLHGSMPPSACRIAAQSVELLVDVVHGQKTGAYLDQQRNRAIVAGLASGARVLDVFSYTGAFSLAALAAGAEHATLIDSSARALQLAREQAVLNGLADRCSYLEDNAFERMRALKVKGEQFDLVILDPPKFVHSADQLRSGARGYNDANRLGIDLVRPGGVLASFSCSGHVDTALFTKIVAGAAADAGRDAQIIETLSQSPDHPVALDFPESNYLKGLILRVW